MEFLFFQDVSISTINCALNATECFLSSVQLNSDSPKLVIELMRLIADIDPSFLSSSKLFHQIYKNILGIKANDGTKLETLDLLWIFMLQPSDEILNGLDQLVETFPIVYSTEHEVVLCHLKDAFIKSSSPKLFEILMGSFMRDLRYPFKDFLEDIKKMLHEFTGEEGFNLLTITWRYFE